MHGVKLTALRFENKMNQTDFWGRIGVTQSGGSRYENGREIPEPVKILLELVYINTQDKAVDYLKKIRHGL